MKRRQYKQKDMTASANKYPQKRFNNKPCKWCKKDFSPRAPSHLFCSDVCKDSSFTDSYFRKTYGITFAEVNKMIEDQNHLCAICNEEGFSMHPNSWSNLNVDHCHNTGDVRGLLCHNCNRALGLLKDSIPRLESAINYLKSSTTIRKEYTQVGGSAEHSNE